MMMMLMVVVTKMTMEVVDEFPSYSMDDLMFCLRHIPSFSANTTTTITTANYSLYRRETFFLRGSRYTLLLERRDVSIQLIGNLS